jgi:hypothetical protein
MEQLRALKQASSARRRQRQLREQEEAEELRRILAQIEQFEQEEAERAEALRREQEKLEEERRQREIEERVRQESIRRREIELKFQQLRYDLEQAHELQRVMLDTRTDDNTLELSREAHEKLEQLEQKQEEELAEIELQALAKLSAKESRLAQDHSARTQKEKHVEEEYFLQLQSYWRGKSCGEGQVQAAMVLLRRRMDKHHQAWEQWRSEQLQMYKARLDDERALREEIMYSVKQRLKDSYAFKEERLAQQILAEEKWFNAVLVEREGLLAAMEIQETEGDADRLFAQNGEREVDGGAPGAAAGIGMAM